MELLNIQNLNSGYGETQILFKVSFSVNKSQIVLLQGKNGSGKTTLLEAMARLLPVYASKEKTKIHFHSKNRQYNLLDFKSHQLRELGITYIPQREELFEGLTVGENLQLAKPTKGQASAHKSQEEQEIEKQLSAILKPKEKQLVSSLSGGERKILSLLMAIQHKLRLLILDEPFAGLDSDNSQKVINLIKAMQKNEKAFIIVEHKTEILKSIAHKTLKMGMGRLLEE